MTKESKSRINHYIGIAVTSVALTSAALFYLGENEEAKAQFKSQLETITEQNPEFHSEFLKENKLDYLPKEDVYINLMGEPIPWRQMNYRLEKSLEE